MVAGGLPTVSSSHAVQCCQCALDMQDAFKDICKKHHLQTGLRIGIGCGEVIAGIIGKSKFSYDLWGEAVNLASRMESHGLSNKIQVTESTYEITKHCFCFDKRGSIEAKGLGWINTYWLVSKKNNLGTKVRRNLTHVVQKLPENWLGAKRVHNLCYRVQILGKKPLLT